MPNGTVKWFSPDKGYGFIMPDAPDNAAEIFVHVSALDDAGIDLLRTGDRVGYEVGADRKSGKPKAINLKTIDVAEQAS